jgi:hypothetical protein
VFHKGPVTRGKGVAVHFTFVNKTQQTVWLASVTGNALREGGAQTGRILGAFEAEGFEPNWDDITGSAGKFVTAESTRIEPMSGVRLVAVCEKPQVGSVESVALEVRTLDGGYFSATGPKED